jgi:hypothetical protein
MLAVAAAALWASPAQAIPAFSRDASTTCVACHTAYPQLNAAGRAFKEAGYRFPSAAAAVMSSEALNLLDDVPISAVLISRPYDEKSSGDYKVRAMHEVELMVAGAIADNWSGFFEIEAEDETGFDPGLKNAVVSYNLSQGFNLQFAYADVFWADPYGFLSDHFRMTRGHVGFIDNRFGGADSAGKLRSARQSMSIYGRNGSVFYNFGIAGVAGDAEGEDASSLFGRVAVDVTDSIMIGAFGIFGDNSADFDRSFDRIGIDFQGDFRDLRLQAAYSTANDDVAGGGPGDVSGDAFSIQAMYINRENGAPKFVPLIRIDQRSTDGVDADYTEVTLNLTYYFMQNIKGYIEYWDQISTPAGVDSVSRITAQLHVVF